MGDISYLLEKKSEFTLTEFCRVGLHELKVSIEDEIYAIAGLIELFNEIRGNSDQKAATISIKEFTSFVVDKIIDASDQSTSVNNKYVSKLTSDNYKSLYKSRKLLEIIPSVYGGSTE